EAADRTLSFQLVNPFVDENSDATDGDYSSLHRSLREIMDLANAYPAPVAITFDSSVFNVAKTLTLTQGELCIGNALTITGPAARLTIDADHKSRIFDI